MNKIIKYLAVLTLIFNISCSSDVESYGDNYDTGWIEMAGLNLDDDKGTPRTFDFSMNYDGDELEIPVLLNTGTNENGLEVKYIISLESGTLNDESILGEKNIFIGTNDYITLGDSEDPLTRKGNMIIFTPSESDYFYTLKFTLAGTNNNKIQIGLSDDSQPIEFTVNVTNYKPYDAVPSAFGENAPEYVTGVGRVDETHFSVKSLWGTNFVAWATGNNDYLGAFANKGILALNPEDNTLTVSGDYVAESGSSGTYDPTTGILSFTFNEDNLFFAGFAINTVLTPQL